MAKRLLPALALLVALTAAPAQAEEGLTIDRELDRPAVRLVVVEFYATWCKPCMEAVPKWKALHEKYRDKGLRLIVVAVQDDGRCTNPGWSPDRMVCDEDGRISEAFRVGQNLPAAFLWSWRGKLLVQRGHVAEVEKAVQAELASIPRVTIGVNNTGPDGAQLTKISDLLRSELRKTGKLEVVASVAERELLEGIRRESQKAGYAENSQCRIGEEVAANSLIKASLQRTGKEPKLLLQLFSAETGCLLQSGMAPWRQDNADQAVTIAVADLMARLRSDTEMPATAKVATAKKPFGGTSAETAKDVDVDDVEEAIVKFLSEPSAAVFVGDKMVCAKTPCSKSVALGKSSVTMSAEEYQSRTETVDVSKKNKEVNWTLKPDFALLNVTCGDNALNVKVDGQSAGACPISAQRLKPGKHRVALDSPCHLGIEEAFEIGRGETRDVALAVNPRIGVVTVKAKSDNGDDLEGSAFLDGKQLGVVPGSYKVPICGKQLEVRADGHAAWSGPLHVSEGDKAKVQAELRKHAAIGRPTMPSAAAVSDDGLQRGTFTWAAYEGLPAADLSVKEIELQRRKIESLQTTIRTIAAMLERNPRAEEAADLQFRMAESYWEIENYAYLAELADFARAWRRWQPLGLQRPSPPSPPIANHTQSLGWYEKIVQQAPNFRRISEVLYRLGVAALRAGMARGDKVLANKGVQYLNKLVQNYSQSPVIASTHLALAEHFFAGNNLTLAKMNYEKVTQNYKTAPVYAFALYKLGWVYFNLREFRRTIETFQQVVREIDPDHSGMNELREQALQDLVVAFSELDHGWPEAKDYFGHAESNAQMLRRLETLAALYAQRGKTDNANELTQFLSSQSR